MIRRMKRSLIYKDIFMDSFCSSVGMQTWQARDARIIIGSFAPSMALPIFCEVRTHTSCYMLHRLLPSLPLCVYSLYVVSVSSSNFLYWYNTISNSLTTYANFDFQQVHRRNLYGADHVRKPFNFLFRNEVSLWLWRRRSFLWSFIVDGYDCPRW